MIIFKMLWSGIKALGLLLATGLKIVYNVLKFLRIRVLALYLILCAILQLAFHVFSGNMHWFWIFFAIFACLTATGWYVYLREKFKRESLVREQHTGHGAPPAEEPEAAPEEEPAQEYAPAPAPTPAPAPAPAPARRPARNYPQFFEVEGHEGYYFAEYPDRYELFRRTEDGDEHIRTDFKNIGVKND